jgi:hypothetical protein
MQRQLEHVAVVQVQVRPLPIQVHAIEHGEGYSQRWSGRAIRQQRLLVGAQGNRLVNLASSPESDQVRVRHEAG